MSENKTNFRNKCFILADLWINYRDDENFADYIAYNDLGLPTAYMIANGILESDDEGDIDESKFPIAAQFVNEAFRLLLDGLEIEDLEFELLDDVFEAAGDGPNGIRASDDTDGDFDSEEEEEEEEEFDYEADDPETVAWERGWRAGIKAEQDRIQGLCEFYTDMYLEEGKGQKAVLWREVADALKPVAEIQPYNPEDDGF